MTNVNISKLQKEKPIKELINFSILNIDKPTDCTSFDVVDKIRRMFSEFGIEKCGHFGTLDTNVSGVLPIAINRACKLSKYFMKSDKEYVGKMKLHSDISKEELETQMNKFIGKIKQLPPQRSNVKRIVREREITRFEIIKKEGKNDRQP